MATGIEVSIGQHSIAGRKERNDDSYGVVVPKSPLLDSKGVAMGIADGMSTSEGAKAASETCMRSFLEDYYATHESWAVKTSVGRVLTALNRWLYSQSQAQYGSENALVSTFSGLVLKAGTAYIFHAGDTRIALVRAGHLDSLTQSHRMQFGRGRESLTRAMGLQPDLVVDYREWAGAVPDQKLSSWLLAWYGWVWPVEDSSPLLRSSFWLRRTKFPKLQRSVNIEKPDTSLSKNHHRLLTSAVVRRIVGSDDGPNVRLFL